MPGSPAASVEHLLKEVQFTGKNVLAGQTGAASTPYAKVLFNYAWRPEARRSVGYASGGTFVQRWQLEVTFREVRDHLASLLSLLAVVVAWRWLRVEPEPEPARP